MYFPQMTYKKPPMGGFFSVVLIWRENISVSLIGQGRFKSWLIDTRRYCPARDRQIELNAVRAGMVEHMPLSATRNLYSPLVPASPRP